MLKNVVLSIVLSAVTMPCFCWGFFGHRLINQYAVFLLPPEMMIFYKPHLDYIYEHAVDPDKRRYAVPEEGARHYIDINNYGQHPFPDLPRDYKKAVEKYGEDFVVENGVVPWHIQEVFGKLTTAFKQKDFTRILRYSSDLGHYIADAHVPLHVSNNHNGQLTDQVGIHALWESRIPELLAATEFDFFIGKAEYIGDPENFIWDRVLESSLSADSVLKFEKILSRKFGDNKFAIEMRNDVHIRQYSSAYSRAFNNSLHGMVERRMRSSIFAVASFWYTAWVNAGQPDLTSLRGTPLSESEKQAYEQLNEVWKNGKNIGREHD